MFVWGIFELILIIMLKSVPEEMYHLKIIILISFEIILLILLVNTYGSSEIGRRFISFSRNLDEFLSNNPSRK